MAKHIQLQFVDRILIQRADRLGDVVLSCPVIESLKYHRPELKIDVLTSPIGAKFLEGHPLISNLYIIDMNSDDKHNELNSLVFKYLILM